MTDLFRAVVIVVAVGLAGLILACEDDPETPPTVTPTASLPSAEFPSGVEDFARTLDRAFSQGEIGLSKFTQYGDWSCPNNYFPAAGPNCVEAADGEGVKAIVIGAYASEGDIYDGPSYGRYLSDWIYDALRDSSDEYGDGAPRVYALADMREEFEGEQGELGNYEIVATRIAESPVDQEAQREVLTFYISSSVQGWLITQILRSPADFLDSGSEEAMANFTAWRQWTEPAPGGPLASRWPDFQAERKVAYLDLDRALVVATADGAAPRVIAEAPCEGGAGSKLPPDWSGDADRVAVPCGFAEPPTNRPSLEIYNVVGQSEPAVIENVSTWAWSPTGHRIAYQTADNLQEEPAAIVRMRDLDSGEDTLVSDNAVLLEWGRQDELLLGLNPTAQASGPFSETYEANRYNITSGATERVERFDAHRQFWMTAGGDQAVVLDGPAGRKEGGATLGVYDLSSEQETALDGLVIGYPSSGIPSRMIQVSPVGGRFAWADSGSGPGMAISEAALDGSQATLLDRVPGLIVSLTSDGLVLYDTFDTVMTLRDTKTGAETSWSEAVIGAIAPVVGGRS